MGLSSSKTKTQSTSSSTPLDQYSPATSQGVAAAQNILANNPAGNVGQQALGVYNGLSAPVGALGSIYGGTNAAQGTLGRLQNATANDPATTALQQSIAAASANPALASLQGMTNGGVNGDTSQYYNDVIGGKYLTNNPYIDTITQQATDAATKAQNQRFALSGMDAGISTPFSQALGGAVADANNQVRAANYNAERQLQNSAAGMSDAEYNATKDRNLSAASSLGNIYNQGVQNKTQAAGVLGSQYNADNQTSLGAANDSLQSQIAAAAAAGTLSQDQLAALSASQSLPYLGAYNYANILNGLTGKYGTTNSSGTSKTSGNLGQMYAQMAGQAMNAFAAGG